MAYSQGGLIEATDFNTFQAQATNIYGVGNGNTGYGQTGITIPTVTGGVDPVQSVEWTALQNVVDACAQHQGTATTLLPPATEFAVGESVTAHDGVTDIYDIPQMLTDITSNRLAADGAAMTLSSNRVSQSVTNAWSSTATIDLEFAWSNADEARYFFNSGGEIRFRLSRSGGTASSQNTSWTDLLTDIGTVTINYDTTSFSGTNGTGSTFGYYDLPSSDPRQIIFTAIATGGTAYDGLNNVVIEARTTSVSGVNGDNGSAVQISVTLNDGYANTVDQVDGTLTVEVDELRATTHLTIPTFSANTLIALNAV